MNNFLDEDSAFSNDFIMGQKACRNGIEHVAGKSAAYDRGYATQYELEQIKTEWSEQEVKK